MLYCDTMLRFPLKKKYKQKNVSCHLLTEFCDCFSIYQKLWKLLQTVFETHYCLLSWPQWRLNRNNVKMPSKQFSNQRKKGWLMCCKCIEIPQWFSIHKNFRWETQTQDFILMGYSCRIVVLSCTIACKSHFIFKNSNPSC